VAYNNSAKDNKYSRLSRALSATIVFCVKNQSKSYPLSTLNGMNAIEFRRISFGCNRRRTCEKTETSEEKAVKEDLEKTRPLTQGKLQGEYW
jgi:hypothetical protein